MTILNQSLLYVAIVLAGIFTCYLLVYKIFLFNKKSKKQEKKQLAEIINKKHLILSDSQKMEISLESKNGKELILVIKDVFYDYKTNKDNYFSLNKSDDKYDVINFSFHQKSIKNKNVGNYKNIIIDLMNAINKFEYLNTTIILEGLSSFVYEFIKEKDKYNFIFVNPVSKRKYLKFSKPAQISYFLGVILNHNKPLHLKFDSSIFSKKTNISLGFAKFHLNEFRQINKINKKFVKNTGIFNNNNCKIIQSENSPFYNSDIENKTNIIFIESDEQYIVLNSIKNYILERI